MTSKTEIPGLLLAIYGGLGVFYALLSIGINLAGAALGTMGNMMSRSNPLDMLGIGGSVALTVAFGAISLLLYGVILYGGLQMRACKNIVFAWIATVMAVIPCGICCLIGTPVGIWCIVTLVDEEVKAAFANNV